MNSFVSQIGKAAVVLGINGLFAPLSVWAAAPVVHTARPAGGSALHTAASTSASHPYVHPTALKANGPAATRGTIASGSRTIGSSSIGGNVVFKPTATKSPTGATNAVPAGVARVAQPSNPPSLQTKDAVYDFFNWLGGGPFKGTDDTSPKPGDGSAGGNDPNHLGNGADKNYGDGAAMPGAQPSKLWSGSSSSVASAGTSAKGTAPRASISLKNGEQVQKHLDQVATANSPAGKIQKGQQIQKQMGNATGKTKSSSTGPAAQLQKGEQIQEQMGNMNTSTSPNPNPNPNPPQPNPSTTTVTPVPFPVWPGLAWGYLGGGYFAAGAAAPGGYDADGSELGAVAPSTTDPATPAVSQPTDGELTLKLGQSYTIANETFGTKAGKLSLQLNGLSLAVHVDQWSADEISFTLPDAGLTKMTEGKFQIQGANGQLLKAVAVMVASADGIQ